MTRILVHRTVPMKVFGHIFGAMAFAVTWWLLYLWCYPLVTSWEAFRREPFEYYYLHLLDDAVKFYLLVTITYAAVIYYRKKEEAARVLAEAQAHQRQMELAVLKAQLNPHYLFNCLNTVNALVGKSPDLAREVLADLGASLRYSLESDRVPLIALADEIEFTLTYLKLEHMRFGDRLQVDWQVDPPATQAQAPPMILQPLVENAVKHGIDQRLDGGQIQITIQQQAEGVQITVRDDGAGSTLSLENMLKKGHGLHHTHLRLTTLFPEQGGLQITSDGGFCVSLFLPQPSAATVAAPAHAALNSLESAHA